MIRVMQEAALGQDERITEGTEQRVKNLFKLFHQHIYGLEMETALSTSGESPSPTLKSFPSIP
jgi:hypothetical protein